MTINVGFILNASSDPPDVDAILAAAADMGLELHAEGDERDPLVFRHASGQLMVMHIDAPHPDAAALARGPLSPPVDALKASPSHTSHLPSSRTTASPLPATPSSITQHAFTAISTRLSAVGGYIAPQPRFHAPISSSCRRHLALPGPILRHRRRVVTAREAGAIRVSYFTRSKSRSCSGTPNSSAPSNTTPSWPRSCDPNALVYVICTGYHGHLDFYRGHT